MSNSPRVIRTAGLMVIGQLGSLLLNLLATVLMVRSLGASDYGMFASLLAILAILMLLPDFGLSPILIREISSKPDDRASIVGSALFLRSLLLVIVVFIVDLSFVLGLFELENIVLLNVLFLAGVFSGRILGHRNVFDAVYRAEMQLEVPVMAAFLDGMLLLMGVLIASSNDAALWVYVLIYVGSQIPGFLLSAYGVLFRRNVRPAIDRKTVQLLLRESVPIAVYVALTAIAMNADILLLSAWTSMEQTGLYGSTIRLSAPLQFIPNAIVAGVFPLQSRIVSGDQGGESDYFGIALKILVALGFVIAVGGVFGAGGILKLVYGTPFMVASSTLSLLFVYTALLFFGFYLTSYNQAKRRQAVNTRVYAVGLAVNLLLNIWLIPQISINGAAWGRVGGELVVAVGLVLTFRHVDRIPWRSIVIRFVPLVLIAFGVWFFARPDDSLFVGIVAGSIACISIFAIGYFDRNELRRIARAIPHSLRAVA